LLVNMAYGGNYELNFTSNVVLKVDPTNFGVLSS